MLFPTICIDDFYNDPDAIREYALSLEFSSPDNLSGRYPGRRTQPLHQINPELFDSFCHKLISIYYDFRTPIKWNIDTSFQLINPLDPSKQSIKNTGWIHQDDNVLFAGIIYLTPNINKDCGTSIFKLNDENHNFDKYEDTKKNFYSSGVDKNYDAMLKENNSSFIETARFDNIYNRLVSFDGNTYHGVNSFYGDGEPRLTQVFFVYQIDTESKTPLIRCKEKNNI